VNAEGIKAVIFYNMNNGDILRPKGFIVSSKASTVSTINSFALGHLRCDFFFKTE